MKTPTIPFTTFSLSEGASMKKPNQLAYGPIGFTAEEIEQARAGNFAPAQKRLKKESSNFPQGTRSKRDKAKRKR
jgi:hypothetical protein